MMEVLTHIKHVLVTYKFKKDRINNNREKVEKQILDAQGQLKPYRMVAHSVWIEPASSTKYIKAVVRQLFFNI